MATFNQTPSLAGKSFSQIHEEYAAKYGARWLNMNELMVRAAESIGVDPSTQKNKLLITVLAARALDVVHNETVARQPD